MDKKCKKIHAGKIIHLQNDKHWKKKGAALWNLKIRPYFQKISLPLDCGKVHSNSHSICHFQCYIIFTFNGIICQLTGLTFFCSTFLAATLLNADLAAAEFCCNLLNSLLSTYTCNN